MRRPAQVLTVLSVIAIASASIAIAPAQAAPPKPVSATFTDGGYSVSVFGKAAFIGSPYEDSSEGAAYVSTALSAGWSAPVRLTASNGAAGDGFGNSVSVGATVAAVGAPVANSTKGAVYVFTKSGTIWNETAIITAPTGAASDYFGGSVSVSGTTIAIGASGRNSGAGAAYIFKLVSGVWTQQALLTANDGSAGDAFGGSVSVAGSSAIVGAPADDTGTGAAYVFKKAAYAGWAQVTKLTADDAAAGALFGFSVGLSGNNAVVGAPFKNTDVGGAYLFSYSTSWSQAQQLQPIDGAAGDYFGISSAISGTSVAVGAAGKKAYVFNKGLTWTQTAQLAPDGPVTNYGNTVAISTTNVMVGSLFSGAWMYSKPTPKAELNGVTAGDGIGVSTAISGSTIMTGAPGRNSLAGSVYVHKKVGNAWQLVNELTAFDGSGSDRFGAAVALSGSTAIVGSPGHNVGRGAAYVFTRTIAGTWVFAAKLTAADGAAGDFFGTSVSIAGAYAIVGAPGRNGNAGAAYFFNRTSGVWAQMGTTVTATAPVALDQFGWSVGLAGTVALVGAPGRSGGGAMFPYKRSGTSWLAGLAVVPNDAVTGDGFGSSLSMNTTEAIVGAPSHGSNGAAYSYDYPANLWLQADKLVAPNGAASDLFGFSVSLYKTVAMVGAPSANSGAGGAYGFSKLSGSWTGSVAFATRAPESGGLTGWSVAAGAAEVAVGSATLTANAGRTDIFGI